MCANLRVLHSLTCALFPLQVETVLDLTLNYLESLVNGPPGTLERDVNAYRYIQQTQWQYSVTHKTRFFSFLECDEVALKIGSRFHIECRKL